MPEFVQRGRQLLEEGQFAEAVKICRLGLLATPGELEGRLILGTALLALQRYDEVLGEMRTALGIDADSAWALSLKGEALLRKGDAAQACDVLTRAMTGAPGDPRIRDLYGEARKQREREVAAPRAEVAALAARLDPFNAKTAFGGQATTPAIDGTDSIDLEPMTEVVDSDMHEAVIGPPPGERGELDGDLEDDTDDGDDDELDERSRGDSSMGIELDTGDLLPGDLSGLVRPPPEARRMAEPRVARAASPIVSPTDTVPPLDTMFPEESVASQPALDAHALRTGGGPSRGRTDDMRMIRSGLGLPSDAAPPRELPPDVLERERAAFGRGEAERARSMSTGAHPTAAPSAPRPRWLRRSARGVPLAVYAVLALAVVAAAVMVGFKVRAVRLERQIAAARSSAFELAAADVYTGYLGARDRFARIVRARDRVDNHAAYARMAARVLAEFGEGEAEAIAALAPLAPTSADALAARAYLAIGRRDASGAREAVAAMRKAFPDEPELDYLTGRALMLSDRPDEAAEALRRALARGGRPLVHVHLALAEAADGREAEALAVLAAARQKFPGHPAAIIVDAWLRARAGQLMTPPGDPEKQLEALIVDGGKPPEAQTSGVSRAETAWAELALAETRLARGDGAAARAALTRALPLAPPDPAFSGALAEALLRAGDVAAARAEAARLVERDPKRPDSQIVLARIALGTGDPVAAIAALEQAGDLSRRAEALTLRGRAYLAAGQLDRAAPDLDAALALRPELTAAVVARAEVDLARGEAAAALKRFEPIYRARATTVDVAVTYAAMVRQDGDVARARAVLEQLGDAGPSYALGLERGRIARAEGNLGEARQALAAAHDLNPGRVEARIELAQLALEQGDAAGYRTALDVLVTDSPDSGVALLEAARAHILVGDHDGAAGLLDRAAKSSSSPPWQLARERGRLQLRRLDASKAIAELDRAKAVRQDDAETHLLALEAALVAANAKAASAALADAGKRLDGTAVLGLCRGIAALLEDRPGEAVAEFIAVHGELSAGKATPRELGRVSYWLGRAFFQDGTIGKSIEWLTQAVQADPSHADAYFYLGVALDTEQPPKAIAAYEKSVALDPAGNPQAWLSIADHYAATKQAAAARKACDEYLKRWPSGELAPAFKELKAKLR